MNPSWYSKLLKFYTGVEHMVGLMDSRYMRKLVIPSSAIGLLANVGREIGDSQACPSAVRDAWRNGVRCLPVLNLSLTDFKDVSAQESVLRLLHYLARFTWDLAEGDRVAGAEKSAQLVVLQPLTQLEQEAELSPKSTEETLAEIAHRFALIYEQLAPRLPAAR